MSIRTLLAAATVAGLAAPVQAQSATATTTTDLNLRAGPGPQYDVELFLPQNTQVIVAGCYAESDWCLVDHVGNEGWANLIYLQGIEDIDVIATITAENVPAADGSRILTGVVVAPKGTDVDSVEIAESVASYIASNPVEPVWLDGEIVTGAGIPDEVTLYPVPEADYVYLNVNALPVVVDPETRRVVYILR